MMTVWPYEQTELQSRPVPIGEKTMPRMDENMDVFLLCGGRVVSRPKHGEWLAEALERALGDLPSPNGREVLTVALPECDRVALAAPLFGHLADRAVAMIPRITLAGMLRVLHHAFDGQIMMIGEGPSHTQETLRESDVHVFAYVRHLIHASRMLAMETGSMDIADRRQLSQRMLSVFDVIERLLGLEIPLSHLPAFPIAFEYCGTFHAASALWMQLLLVLGLYRGFPTKIWNSARLIADDELLLPTLEISAGNRTPLPYEWEEGVRMAQAAGMFFDIRRKRDSIRVRFCPMTPHISPVEFYSVKAMAPIIEGLGEMKLR